MLKLRLDHVFDMRLTFGEETRLDAGPLEFRRAFLPVTSGSVLGPRLVGDVVAGSGGEWPRLEAQSAIVEGQWLIRTADGVTLVMKSTGYLREAAGVSWRGDGAAFDAPTLQLAPIFEAPAGPHEWLTRTVFVGKGNRRRSDATFKFYAVM